MLEKERGKLPRVDCNAVEELNLSRRSKRWSRIFIYIYIYLFGFDEGEFRLTFQPLKSATKNIFDIDHALPSGSRM